MNCDCQNKDGFSTKLFVISFTVLKEAGLALVAAKDEKQAFQILQNSGSRNCHNGNHYTLIQIRDIGMITSCHYGLLMESFVNALEAYDAILNAANKLRGPKGDKGEDGASAISYEAIIEALGFIPVSSSDLDGKVDKIPGKGLSTNDFTDSYKSKLDGIDDGAEQNVQSDWLQDDNTSDDFIKNKPDLSMKQDTLVSGDNIKTINGQSILGPGNITISGGDVPPGTYVTPSDMEDAIADALEGVEFVVNKVTSVSPSSDNTKYASAKAVYDAANIPVATSIPQGGMLPNVAYYLGQISGSVTFTLAQPSDNNVANLYVWQFRTGQTAPTITWPSGITEWNGGSAPVINSNSAYEVTVLNGYATILTTRPV